MLRVLGLGGNMVDKYMYIRTMYLGENTSSFVVYVRTFGMEAGYLGVFGDDEVAAHVYDTIRGLGLEFSHCRFYPGENGCAEVRLDNGDRVFIGPDRGGVLGKHSLELTVMDRAYIANYDVIRTNIFNYMEDELLLIRRALSFVFMDFSDRADEEYLRRCVPYVDCASISCGNIPRSEIEKQTIPVQKFGCRHIIIVTRGVKGALVMVDGRLYEQSPCLIEAVDTTGAGDPFTTCLLINCIDAMKDSRDFPSTSGAKGTVAAADYRDSAVRASLYRVVVYSAGNCQKGGSLGFDRVFQYE